ncbi:MAG: glycine zipper 2TM domain-containing protein [Sphingomonadaceae bacterium]|nr:glycine zipper 2TM domain-containing protein [Sphingomonadaceae bacterium]
MRRLILAATLAAAVTPALPALAQYGDRSNDSSRAQHRMDWRRYRQYDYNRTDPTYNGYYADRYYRDDPSYRERQLAYNDRVYRGNDGRYYCRRSDGTTGLIIGAGVGALFGNAITNGNSSLLGTLLGAGAGAAIGSSIDRNSNRNVRCR